MTRDKRGACFDSALRAQLSMRKIFDGAKKMPHPELAPTAHVEGRVVELQSIAITVA
ncbi:MAG TPA: hypothetical protein VET85_08780 [Stellaceae bacterium]|nr:hypothetical protein [Stellaceae bacterium]